MAMPMKPAVGQTPWTDPDDAPELTDEFFARADTFEGEKLVRRGRPRLAAPKKQVTLRLDPAVVDGLRATGPGWQTKANAVLKYWLKRSEGAMRQAHRGAREDHVGTGKKSGGKQRGE
jgi:uncharacterized protein (DUF4415 family)